MNKNDLTRLTEKPYWELTETELEKLIDAFYKERLAPRIKGLYFTLENVNFLLSLSHCRSCGRCCLPDKRVPDHPGIIVSESELKTIAKSTRHNLKSLKTAARVSDDIEHNPGARYLPLPCLFYNQPDKTCKVYPFRPEVCRTFPVSNCEAGDITISLRCDYGKDIFRNLIKERRKNPIPVTKLLPHR